MTELQDLVARCEAASGPDDALNNSIMATRYRLDERYIGAHCADTGERVTDIVWVDPETDKWVCTGSFAFTGSIDDAMRLVPRGWVIDAYRAFDDDGEHWSKVILLDSFSIGRGTELGDRREVMACGPGDLPTKIVAAALKALALCSNNRSSQGEA